MQQKEAPKFETKTLTVITDKDGDIVGQVLFKGKHCRYAKYNGGTVTIENHDSKDILRIEDGGVIDYETAVELVRLVDRKVTKLQAAQVEKPQPAAGDLVP